MTFGTVTMSKLGANQAVARGVPLSAAAAGSDNVTLLHGLGRTPEKILLEMRSLVNAPSLGAPVLAISSYDQTKIVVTLESTQNQAQQVQIDVYGDLVWSACR